LFVNLAVVDCSIDAIQQTDASHLSQSAGKPAGYWLEDCVHIVPDDVAIRQADNP